MSIFGGLLGAGVSLLGQNIANNQRESAAKSALQASRPYDVRGIFGRAKFDNDDDELTLRLNPQLQQGFNSATALGNQRFTDLNRLDFVGREQEELGRLQTLRAPQIDQARQQLQSRLLARGRLGLATGGGVSNSLFNPESAALEEAIMRTQLGDIGAARSFSQQEQGFLQNSAQGAFSLAGNIGQLPNQYAGLGITAGRNADPRFAAMPGMARAHGIQGFFSDLGNQLPSIFGATGQSPGLPPGARPNGLGGLFL